MDVPHFTISYLFRRYSYFPNFKWTTMPGGVFDGWREPREINAVYKILFTNKKPEKERQPKPGKYTKIYERGDNTTRERLPTDVWGWRHKNTNRVRLEFTIHRKNRSFHRIGLKTLHDLLVESARNSKKYASQRKVMILSNSRTSNPKNCPGTGRITIVGTKKGI